MDIYEIRRENLRAIVKSRFNGKITGLAEAVDRAHSYISRCLTKNETHRKNIGEEFARNIEMRLRMPPLALDAWGDNEHQDSNVLKIPQPILKQNKYPLIDWDKAKAWANSSDNFKSDEKNMYLESSEDAGKNGFWMAVRGDSMASISNPNFPEGSKILVCPGAEIVSGKYYLVILESGEQTFKQYVEDSGHRYLRPLNPNYRTIEIDDKCHFIGRVIDIKMTGL